MWPKEVHLLREAAGWAGSPTFEDFADRYGATVCGAAAYLAGQVTASGMCRSLRRV